MKLRFNAYAAWRTRKSHCISWLRVCVFLVILAGLLGSCQSIGDDAGKAQFNMDLPPGASFTNVEAISQTVVFSYQPSRLHIPAPMMTPVVFVYADHQFKSRESAWEMLCSSGLKALAESERAGVMIINPVGGEWGQADDEVYQQLLNIVSPGRGEPQLLGYSSYLNLFHIIGLGSGADYVNKYIVSRQDRANMVSSVLLVSAQNGPTVEPSSMPRVPAYLVDPNPEALAYFQALNDTDSTDQSVVATTYFDSHYPVRKVIVDNSNTAELTPAVTDRAWRLLMRKTMRHPIEKPVWSGGHSYVSEHAGQVIQPRPVPEELGLVFNSDVTSAALPNHSRWFEWVPEEILDIENTECFPLLMVYHGRGDHPVYEADSNGWVALAGEERIIVVAPEDNSDPDNNNELIRYIMEKYPVDPARIYMTGFSAGGAITLRIGEKYVDTFAAVASLAPPIESQAFNYQDFGWNASQVDLPVFLSCSTNERGTTLENPNGGMRYFNLQSTINSIMELNEVDARIDSKALDFKTFEFYGSDVSDRTEKIKSIHSADLRITSYANADGIDMIRYSVMWGGDHNHYTAYAALAWDFMKHFTRNVQTKELVYTP